MVMYTIYYTHYTFYTTWYLNLRLHESDPECRPFPLKVLLYINYNRMPMLTPFKSISAIESSSSQRCTKLRIPLSDAYCKPKEVRTVPIEETKARFGQNWMLLNFFSNSFEISGDIFGVEFEEASNVLVRKPPKVVLGRFMELLHNAVERLRRITEISRQAHFPISFDKHGDFATGCGYLIEIGVKYLEEFRKTQECEQCLETRASIESQYFHELLHRVRLYRQDEDGREMVPMMGEFLYDPQMNKVRNEVFKQLGTNLGQLLKSTSHPDHTKDVHSPYLRDWVHVSRILLFQYKMLHTDFSLPSSASEQVGVVEHLASLFQSVDAKTRDEILKRFVHLSASDIETISADCKMRLGLHY